MGKSSNWIGFTKPAPVNPRSNLGSLSSETFVLDGVTYTIKAIAVASAPYLYFVTEPSIAAHKDRLTLHFTCVDTSPPTECDSTTMERAEDLSDFQTHTFQSNTPYLRKDTDFTALTLPGGHTVADGTAAVRLVSTDPIWTSEMTVGSSGDIRGFSSVTGSTYGELDPVALSHGGVDYTIEQLSFGSGSGEEGIWMSANIGDDAGFANLVLQVGEYEVPVEGRRTDQPKKVWFGTLPDDLSGGFSVNRTLPVGAVVTLCLRAAGEVCSTGSITVPELPPVWATTVTIGEIVSGEGFGYNGKNDPVIGALGEDEFEYDGTTYTVKVLRAASQRVLFEVDPEGLPEEPMEGVLTLEIANTSTEGQWTMDFHDREFGTNKQWRFEPDGGPSYQRLFPVGGMATACLRAAGQTCPAASFISAERNIEFGAATYTAAEGGTAAVVTVELSGTLTGEAVVPLTATPQGGATTSDYTGVPANLTFAAGTTTLSFTVTATQDTDDDDGESVALSFGTLPDGLSAGTQATATVSLTDDDDPPTVNAADASAAEGAMVNFVVTLATVSGKTVTVAYATSVASGDTASANDFTPKSGTLTFAPGEQSKTVQVTTTDDTADEDDETFTLTLQSATNGTLGDATASGTINDGDDPPGLSVADATAAEGQAVNFTVTLSPQSGKTVTVDYATSVASGDTASTGDFTAASGTLTFAPGEATKTVSVSTTTDTEAEGNETFTLTLSGESNATLSDATVTGTITQVAAPAVTLSLGAASINEGGSGNSTTLTAAVSPASPTAFTVTVSASPTGRVELSATTIAFAAMATRGSATLTVSAEDNAVDNADAEVTLSGTVPSGVTAPADVTLTVTDDEVPANDFASTVFLQNEGDSFSVIVQLRPPPYQEVELGYTTTAAVGAQTPATAGVDYTAVSGTLTFTAGAATRTVTIDSIEDELVEGREIFDFEMSVPAGQAGKVALGIPSTRFRIDNDDFATIATEPVTVGEGSGPAEVTVTMSKVAAYDVMMDYETQAGTATAGSDYTASSGKLTIVAGEQSASVTVAITNDTTEEAEEAFTVALTELRPLGADITLPANLAAAVTITDDDVPGVKVSYGAGTYEAAEGGTVVVTVTLSEDPGREVTIPLTATNRGATDADYSGVPDSLTFESGDTAKSFTVTVAQDTEDDDGELVALGFGTLPAGVTPGTRPLVPLNLLDDDGTEVGVSFGAAEYTVAEGGTVVVAVSLATALTSRVVIALTKTHRGGVTGGDYTGIPAKLTFEPGDTVQSFTVTATQDTEDDDGESVDLIFSSLPAGLTAASPSGTSISIEDNDDPAVTVSFGSTAYTAPEGGGAAVTVTLSADPERTVVLTLTTSNQDGATDGDYSGVPTTVTFASGQTARTFTVTATDDADDDDGESVDLGFGGLPTGVTAVNPTTTTVNFADNDEPALTVSFGAATYTATEGGTAAAVTVTLSADPERTVVLTLTTSNQDGASDADYSGIPDTLTFHSGDIEQEFTVTATDDDDNDDGESVDLSFGTLPTGVTAVNPTTTTVNFADDDAPTATVQFGAASYTVAEGATVTVTVVLSADPERTVTVPITSAGRDGAGSGDYTASSSVTFTSGQLSANLTVTATQDTADDDGETVALSFGTLPAELAPGTRSTATVAITDDDDPAVTVKFGASSYTAAEGGTATVTVTVSATPERALTIPITRSNQGGATNPDLTGVPSNVIFAADETSKSFTVSATDDGVDDDGESVNLGFGSLPAGVTAANPTSTAVSITDGDDPVVEVSFGAETYTVAEGGRTTVTVTLSADPERTVVIPISKTENMASSADYSGVPASVTFASGQTSRSFTVAATQDTVDDDDESVGLSFGTLPDDVDEGSPTSTTISITDDDDPVVTVAFEEETYRVDEAGSVTVTVRLSADPERTVAIGISATGGGGATSADYTVPASVTFTTGQTSRTFSVDATDDDIDDDGESVILGFRNLPSRVSGSGTTSATVNITDDDDPEVDIQFSAATYTATEDGTAAVVMVTLSADPERTVTVPLTRSNQGGATNDDYTVQENVTFTTGQTLATLVTVTATDDEIDDDGESVVLGFGARPDRVDLGTRMTTTVNFTDNDVRGLAISTTTVAIDETDGNATGQYTVALTSEPTDTVMVALLVVPHGDLPTVPTVDVSSLTFAPGNWDTPQTVTVTAAHDNDAEDETAAITHAVSGGDYGIPENRLVVVEVDDDEVASTMVTLTTDITEVAEGAPQTVTVTATWNEGARKRQTTMDVLLAGGANTEPSDFEDPGSFELQIEPQALSGTATFTLEVVADSLWEPEPESVLVDVPVPPTGLTVVESRITLTSNDPEPRLSLTGPSEMPETGGSVELELSITNGVGFEDAQTADLTFGGNATAGTDYTQSPSGSSLTLAAGAIGASATLTLTAVHDETDEDDGTAGLDDEDERIEVQATYQHPDGSNELDETLEVAILDDDHPTVTVAYGQAAYDADEGDEVQVSVLVTVPDDDGPERELVIPVMQAARGGATEPGGTKADWSGVPAAVTFAASGTAAQQFTVAVTQDDIDDDGESVALSFGSMPDTKVSAVAPTTSAVNFGDEDERGLRFNPANLSIRENLSETYAVALTSEPTDTVTVALSPPRALSVEQPGQFGVTVGSLTFTASDWDTEQTLSARSLGDGDSVTEEELVGHAASGGDYGSLTENYTVTVTDTDSPAMRVRLRVSHTRFENGDLVSNQELPESGDVNYTVSMTAALDGAALDAATTVVVTVSGDTADSSDYTLATPTLTLVIPADEVSVQRDLSLGTVDDGVDEDDETIALTGTAMTGTTTLQVTAAELVIVDDDTRGVSVSESLLELGEGETGTYTVALDSVPTGPVTVTVTSDQASVTANPPELAFTATDTGPKTVTVTAEEDADGSNERAELSHRVTGADYGTNNVAADPVTVTVDDNEESSSAVTLELSPATVAEDAGATAVTVTGRLDGAAPTVALTVTVVLAPGTADQTDYALDRSQVAVVIEAGMVTGSATVMLTPADDGVDENDETVLVTGTAPNGLTVVPAALTITDDDTRGVTVSTTALALDEGESQTYTVTLDSAPTGLVTVTVSASGDAEASVRTSPAVLAFTPTDTGPKTVTVWARGDRDEIGGTVTVSNTVTGANSDYAAQTAEAVTVTVTDTGIVQWDVELSVDDMSALPEGGGPRSLVVTAALLTGAQAAAVPVSVTVSGGTADSSDFRASPAQFTLTIPAGAEEAERTITLTPTDDGMDESDETVVVAPSVEQPLTTNEEGVTLTITDDDTRGVTVSPTTLTFPEGASGSYTVSLGSQPSASVTVAVTLSGSDSVTASPSQLVFTSSSWRRAQAVRVTSRQDDDPDDEPVRITHAVTGGDYEGEAAASVTVAVEDDDKPSTKVTLSASPTSVSEGGGARSVTVTGRLDGAPEVQDVTVTLSAGGGTASSSDYMAAAVVLTITAGQTETRAAFTVEPTDDGVDEDDETLVVSGALSSGQMLSVEPAAGLTVTIVDDDERGVTVTPTALTVAEGESRSYEVALGSEPDGSVQVTASLSDDDGSRATGAGVMPSTLTFTAADWRMAQTVTVEVSDDSVVEADATATIAHAVSGADYGTNGVTAASVTVSVPGYELNAGGDGVLLLVADGAVTVPSGTPAPAGLSLAFPVAHDEQTVTVVTVPAPGDEPRGFSLGDTVVDISGVELGSGETATVCLPASAGGELSVQRWDEANQVWVELDEPPGGSPSGRVCGVTGQFSVFAVMVRLEEPELVFSADALTVTIGEEEGATYTVALGLEPAGSVTVTVSGHEGTELSVAPATLVFTEGDWNVAQAVTATVSDEAEAGSEAMLTHTASGGRYLGDWEKTLAVTVERDSGLLQRAREAWLARFGRTAAGHVAEAVAERLAAPAGQETQLALGGAQPRQALVAGVLQTLAGESRPDGRRMLADSAFVLALGSDGEQSWTAWGRGAYTEFDGEEDGLELDGEVASGTLGVDVERGDWRLGLALSHSEGEGEIREAEGDRYELESSLTGAYPYARWQLDETLSVWGVLGWGEGELEQERDGERTETDLEMRMAAFGARGGLGGVEFGSGTFDLSLKSDLLAVRVEADADEDEDLPEVEADAQRVRLLLEGAGHCPLESGGILAPTLEAGLRYDEGDAETGLGAELGAGLRYADASGRLSAALNARGLLAHEESGYEEWGVSGSLRLDPDASGRGWSLKLESGYGATGSETDELWSRHDLSGLVKEQAVASKGSFEAELGYGLNGPGGRGILTPYLGYERDGEADVWRLGGRLENGPAWKFDLEGRLRHGTQDAGHEIVIGISGRW